RVRMPGQAWDDNEQPLPGVVEMTERRRARFVPDAQEAPRYDYRFAVSKQDSVNKPDDAWFDRVGEKLKDAGGKLAGEPKQLKHQDQRDAPGRQWTFELGDGGTVRVVQVYAIKGRV